MDIREIKFDSEEEEGGIECISFVESPAIEKNFIYFNDQHYLKTKGIKVPYTPLQKLLHPKYTYRYWKVKTVGNEKPIIDTSHEFCKNHVDKVFHIDDIRDWHTTLSTEEQKGWINESDYCANFNGKPKEGYKLDNQLYNCRHYLEAITDINDVPKPLLKILDRTYSKMEKENFSINFEVSNSDQKTVKGVAMIPNILIYRIDKNNKEYYVYFSEQSIMNLYKKFGFNRTISVEHNGEDLTGNAILMNSWIYDGTNDNCGFNDLKKGSWCLEYKVLNDKLFNMIKNKEIKGFSVELVLP